MATNGFVMAAVRKVSVTTVYDGIYPYLAGMAICLIFAPDEAQLIGSWDCEHVGGYGPAARCVGSS